MDEYKSNQIKYEQNTNKSNQIKYAAAEKRIQIIQIKYATCGRILFVWGTKPPRSKAYDHFEGVSEEMNKESGGWRVANLIESVCMYGNDHAKGTNLKTKKNIFEYNKSNTNTNTTWYTDFAGTNK